MNNFLFNTLGMTGLILAAAGSVQAQDYFYQPGPRLVQPGSNPTPSRQIQVEENYGSSEYVRPNRQWQPEPSVFVPPQNDHEFVNVRELGFAGEICNGQIIITRVTHRSEACRIGLEEGDTILSMNRRKVFCEHDIEDILSGCQSTVCMLVRHGDCGRITEVDAQLPRYGCGHRRQSVYVEPIYERPTISDYDYRRPMPYSSPRYEYRGGPREQYDFQMRTGKVQFGVSLGR
ncbi:PDZ domain-containing protein [Rubinisphaera margarita]|uniref:PDZ domain-containing protein n=1 Tax=Rubinisphaera margarita TaxID=2909586 RepID=UPI001EE7E2D5|nr:PDZ domain-containing protein [Rubinisphaera margarita]MCG6156223.1 PDZ domain-containing protein [Rubinisphaera margarita]